MKFRIALAATVLALASSSVAFAQGNDKLTLHPNGFRAHSHANWKAQEGLPDSKGNGNHALYMQKETATGEFAAALAVIKGLEGKSPSALTGLEWEHRNDGHCGAGAPRWNLVLQDETGNFYFVFLGCAAAAHSPGSGPNWTRDTYSAAAIQTAVANSTPAGANLTIAGLAIVFDEGQDQGVGYTYLDNIKVNNKTWTGPTDNGNK